MFLQFHIAEEKEKHCQGKAVMQYNREGRYMLPERGKIIKQQSGIFSKILMFKCRCWFGEVDPQNTRKKKKA